MELMDNSPPFTFHQYPYRIAGQFNNLTDFRHGSHRIQILEGKLFLLRISLRRLSTSINGLLNRPQEEAQQQEEQLDKSQTSQFDQDQVEKEWLSMCNRMTAAYPGLSARMKNLLPHITEYPNIELVVDNSILLDQLNAIRSRIRATLAHYLHNGNIEFTIRLAKADEVTKILTKRELFDEMRQKNPAIERLRQLLDLEMA